MKRILFFLALSSLIISSCSNDDDYIYVTPFYNAVGTIEGSGDSIFILSDNGIQLIPNSYRTLDKLSSGQRLIVDYSVIKNYYQGYSKRQPIDINQWDKILTKNVIKLTSSNADSIGNNPFVSIQNIWVASNYLNFIFTYSGYSKAHMLNLVETDSSSSDTIHLAFRQNAYGDQNIYQYQGIVSFNISSLEDDTNTSTTLAIDILFSNGTTKTFYRTYEWGAVDASESYNFKKLELKSENIR